ncbi:MAG TPA: helix-turn-helix transcriptional regulator [Propionibacteriaceae bacterium]|nr:helix-turn-helix transcriptional regulator [Propionibacteriaceae bacterium]
MARIKAPHLSEQLGSVGEFIAAQRRAAELSLRQLAEQTGVSNPYLSQIERGLRRPSAEVLQQLSKALRVSAETLYVRAGILDPTDHPVTTVEMAVLADAAITERQKRVLIDVYASFVKENADAGGGSDKSAAGGADAAGSQQEVQAREDPEVAASVSKPRTRRTAKTSKTIPTKEETA